MMKNLTYLSWAFPEKKKSYPHFQTSLQISKLSLSFFFNFFFKDAPFLFDTAGSSACLFLCFCNYFSLQLYNLSKLTAVSFPVKVYFCTKQMGFDFDIHYKKSRIHHETKAWKKIRATAGFTWVHCLFSVSQKFRVLEAC